MGRSKCSNLARNGDVHMCTSEMLLEVAGEWWWAPNEYASLPKEGPLGPVLKQSHFRLWGTKWATASKCGDVTRFRTCMAVPGCGKMTRKSMGRCMVVMNHAGLCHAVGRILVQCPTHL